MRVKYKKAIFATLAIGVLLPAIILIFDIGPHPSDHVSVKVEFSRYNENSDIVCSVTFSNRSDLIFLALPGTPIDYLTNGNWVHTLRPEPGAISGPFFPHHVYQTKIVVPGNATEVRVGDFSEHLPAMVEKVAAIPRERLSWGMWWYASKALKTKMETNWSDRLDLVPFNIAKTNGSVVPNLMSN